MQETPVRSDIQRAQSIKRRHVANEQGNCIYHLLQHNVSVPIDECRTRQWAEKLLGDKQA